MGVSKVSCIMGKPTPAPATTQQSCSKVPCLLYKHLSLSESLLSLAIATVYIIRGWEGGGRYQSYKFQEFPETFEFYFLPEPCKSYVTSEY